ncbi:MAG TPA: hypothetical protein VM307_05070 [Egibacteraceae bacterium]|nr:hypothetical protein [Egibacteraceae bacterium]
MASTITKETTRVAPIAAPEVPETASKARYAWALARITLGLYFLWAFLDKTFALGWATGRNPETGLVDRFGEAAWINGGSPTFGFLNFGTNGPFAGFFQSFAGAAWADWLFMIGLLGIGVALILGVGVKIAAVSGAAMMALMYAAAPILEHNPVIDDHVVYAIVLIGLMLAGAGRTWGLGRRWSQTTIVQRFPILE